jgi:hypothetical protein
MPDTDLPPALLRAGPPRPVPPGGPRAAALDAVGAAVSCACAAHCLLLPAAATLLPTLAGAALLGEPAEWALLGTTVLVGVSSFGAAASRAGRAARRTARGALAPVLFACGVAVLVGTRIGVLGAAAEGGARERSLVLAGATLVAAAHLTSWRRGRRCAAR